MPCRSLATPPQNFGPLSPPPCHIILYAVLLYILPSPRPYLLKNYYPPLFSIIKYPSLRGFLTKNMELHKIIGGARLSSPRVPLWPLRAPFVSMGPLWYKKRPLWSQLGPLWPQRGLLLSQRGPKLSQQDPLGFKRGPYGLRGASLQSQSGPSGRNSQWRSCGLRRAHF